MTLRLAIFDCDGTLVDSQGAIIAAMRAAAEHCDQPEPTAHAVRRVVGLPLLEAVCLLFPAADTEHHLAIEASYKLSFSAARQQGLVSEPLYPGARASLDYLDCNGWLLGVATGKSHRGLVATLSHHELLERFVTLQTADTAAGKPNPDMLHRAMNDTGATKAETIMIGDTTYDMLMARNAGVPAIGVAWGYHESHELMDAGAAMVIDDFDHLVGAIHAVLD